jgi:hypothetical protein
MAFTQGSPLPDIKETTTRAQEAPKYYTDYLTGLAGAGTTAMGRTPQQMIAGLDPLQMQAYQQTPGAAGAYQPGLSAATANIAETAQGITPDKINQFMNPYTQNVVQEMARLAEQNVGRNILPALKAGMVGSGQLGSQRYAGALGQGLAEASKTLTGQQYGALSEGYKTAVDAALKEMGLETEAAKTQANISKLAQDLGLAETGALEKAGATQQAYQQALLDAPLKTATQAQGLLRGFTIPQSETQTFVGPRAGAYGLSDLSQITGLMSVLGAARAGSPLESGLNALLRGLGRTFNIGGGGGGSYFLDAAGNPVSVETITSETPPL